MIVIVLIIIMIIMIITIIVNYNDIRKFLELILGLILRMVVRKIPPPTQPKRIFLEKKTMNDYFKFMLNVKGGSLI